MPRSRRECRHADGAPAADSPEIFPFGKKNFSNQNHRLGTQGEGGGEAKKKKKKTAIISFLFRGYRGVPP